MCGACVAALPKSRALALLDGVSHLLWMHGGFGILIALAAMCGGVGQLGQESMLVGLGVGVYGLFLLVMSVIQIVAGMRLQEYRGLKLGWLACASALVAAPGCGFAPSVMLGISGLVILMNPGVRAAFAAVDSGMDQREMERIHLPRDDEKFSIIYVVLVVVLSLVGWCGLTAVMSAVGQAFNA